MHDDLFEGACAASDLSARLLTEVSRAIADLQAAEHRYADGSRCAGSSPATVPFGLRRDVTMCRKRLAALRQILAGVLGPDGGNHAASA